MEARELINILYGETQTITGKDGSSIEIQTIKIDVIRAETGYTLLKSYTHEDGFWETPIIAWQVEVRRRVERHQGKDGRRYREVNYITSVTPVTVEDDEERSDWAIEMPTGKIDIPFIAGPFDNRQQLADYWKQEKAKEAGAKP